MARRGENIYKRKDGRWEGRYIKSRYPDNRIHYGYVYARTFREVREKLLEKKYTYQDMKHLPNKPQMTVYQWVRTWLNEELPTQVKPSTYASYHHKLTKYILPYFQQKPLYTVTQESLQQLIHQLIEKGLSVTTVQTSLRIFKRCLKTAIQQLLLPLDPFVNLHYPFQLKQKIRALSLKEQKQLEEQALRTEAGLPIVLALHTGLRIGEISALKWSDIDFKRRELTVTKTLQRIFSRTAPTKTELHEGYVKSQSAHRVIPLNKRIWSILRQQKQTHEGEYVVGKKATFSEPRLLTYHFKRILQKLSFPNIRFHQLRHTFATRLLEKGADIASVSALLGHQSVKMTLDTYTDSLMAQRKNGSIG